MLDLFRTRQGPERGGDRCDRRLGRARHEKQQVDLRPQRQADEEAPAVVHIAVASEGSLDAGRHQQMLAATKDRVATGDDVDPVSHDALRS
jgi:hypothetical protein